MYRIAQRYNLTVDALLRANPGVDPRNLQVGQSICIPDTPDGRCPGGQIYTIRAGDTFYELAQRFGVPLESILQANPEVDPDRLRIGQEICIPAVGVPSLPCCSVLGPEDPAVAASSLGVVGVGQVATGSYALTFAATNLPEPSELGDFNRYVGLVILAPTDEPPPRFSALLEPSQILDQPITWSGTRVIGEAPGNGTILQIRPFNTETGVDGAPVLVGQLECT